MPLKFHPLQTTGIQASKTSLLESPLRSHTFSTRMARDPELQSWILDQKPIFSAHSSGEIAVVTVLPWDFDFNAVRDQYDGLFLSNGPGDPQSILDTVERVKIIINEWDKPIFGICMGHQIIGMAAGMEAYRMKFGNRGS